jgi:pyruvate dehydrogenase (quinone)
MQPTPARRAHYTLGQDGWEEAFSSDRPVVYEAIVDAEVPPHISFDQAKSMTRALYRGPAAAGIIRYAFAELVEEYMSHR